MPLGIGRKIKKKRNINLTREAGIKGRSKRMTTKGVMRESSIKKRRNAGRGKEKKRGRERGKESVRSEGRKNDRHSGRNSARRSGRSSARNRKREIERTKTDPNSARSKRSGIAQEAKSAMKDSAPVIRKIKKDSMTGIEGARIEPERINTNGGEKKQILDLTALPKVMTVTCLMILKRLIGSTK